MKRRFYFQDGFTDHRKVVSIGDHGSLYIGNQFFCDGEWLDDNDSGATLSLDEFREIAAELKALL